MGREFSLFSLSFKCNTVGNIIFGDSLGCSLFLEGRRNKFLPTGAALLPLPRLFLPVEEETSKGPDVAQDPFCLFPSPETIKEFKRDFTGEFFTGE